MKMSTPSIPIRLPTNSTVSFRLPCKGAKMKASITPTAIIGIPIPAEICFEAISLDSSKNLYEFYVIFGVEIVITAVFNPINRIPVYLDYYDIRIMEVNLDFVLVSLHDFFSFVFYLDVLN